MSREKQEGWKPYRVRMDGCLYEIMYDRECTVYRVELNQRHKVLDAETINRVHLKMKKMEESWTITKAHRMIWGALRSGWL